MADDRIKDLPGTTTTAQLNALIDTLYFAVDDTTFTDAEKILIKSILFEDLVLNNSNNYQAMTPRAFYNNIMTATRRGVGTLANDNDIGLKVGDGLLRAVSQTLMQSQWKIDWFESNPIPKIYKADNLELPRAIAFDVTFNQSMVPLQNIAISPVLPAGYRFSIVNYSWAASTGIILGGGFSNFSFTGAIVYGGLVAFDEIYLLSLSLSANGREISIYTPVTGAMLASLHINALIVPV